MKRYSATVLIETDGDPHVAMRAMQEALVLMAKQGYGYAGPDARFHFGPVMSERDAH